MKKTILLMVALMTAIFFSACSQNASGPPTDLEGIQVIATIFPEYDWVMNILGDNPGEAETFLLVDNGVDLHSFQPSAEDILRISTCDLFIYVGGESDAWVTDALKEAVNPDMIVINLLDILGDFAKEEELAEGMQAVEETGEEAEEIEYDEHVWLSLKNAVLFCDSISEALCRIDPENKDTYEKNLISYTEKLEALDEQYRRTVEGSVKDTLLFGDRFPFRYLTEDYGLKYYAAFAGCSAETEASFDTIAFLADKVNELGLTAVFTIDGGDTRLAESIIQMTETGDQKILELDSMQTITPENLKNGDSFLSIMEKNLEVLAEGLE